MPGPASDRMRRELTRSRSPRIKQERGGGQNLAASSGLPVSSCWQQVRQLPSLASRSTTRPCMRGPRCDSA
eukprot:479269-Hanusia_phi.AAC.2